MYHDVSFAVTRRFSCCITTKFLLRRDVTIAASRRSKNFVPKPYYTNPISKTQ